MRSLAEKLQKRDDMWADNYPRLSNIIFDKTALAAYAMSKGWPSPKTISVVPGLDKLDYDSLPYRFVLKPDNNWSCNGVLLIRDGRELISGDNVEYLKGYIERRMGKNYVHGGDSLPPPRSYIVEELLEDYNPVVVIPRDFKVYVVKGKPKLIHVIDRNVKLNGASAASAYTPNWQRKFIGNGEFYEGIDLVPEIDSRMLRQLFELAADVGNDIGATVRVDCYLTPNGPTLGEITASPGGGNNLNASFCRSLSRWIDSDNVCPHWAEQPNVY